MKYRLYSPEDLRNAYEAVKSGTMTVTQAHKFYKIPRQTLARRINGNCSLECKSGAIPWLGIQAENEIVKQLMDRLIRGFQVTKSDIQDLVQNVVQAHNLKTPFKEGRPGKKWTALFFKRHPELKDKCSRQSTPVVSKEQLRDWFRGIGVYLTSYFSKAPKSALEEFLKDSRRWFYLNQIEFVFSKKFGNYISMSDRNPEKPEKLIDSTIITVIFTDNANGELIPVDIIYNNYQHVPTLFQNNFPKEWHCLSNRGDATDYTHFLSQLKTLVEYAKSNEIQFPILVYVENGRDTQQISEINEYCYKNQVILYFIHQSVKCIIQSENTNIVSRIKSEWEQYTVEHRTKTNQEPIATYNFAPLFYELIKQIPPELYQQAFIASGLFPLSENNIDYSQYEDIESNCDLTELPLDTILVEPDNIADTEIALKKIEEIIPKDVLKQFYDSLPSGQWLGDIVNKGLFDVWMTLINELNSLPDLTMHSTSSYSNDENDDDDDDDSNSRDSFLNDCTMSEKRSRGRLAKSDGDSEKSSSKRKGAAKEAPVSKRSKSSEETPGPSGENGSSKLNPTKSEFNGVNYDEFQKTTNDKKCNFKIVSWNAGGLRALLKKGGFGYVDHEKPDIFCLQEIKVSEDKLPAEAKLPGYFDYWATGKGGKEGYAGVALYSKKKPLSVVYGLGIDEHDTDGRVITAEYDDFYVVNTYVPNSGRGLVTLPKRLEWNKDFHKYLEDLDKKKPVILAGDLNVSHKEIDLARPKNNTKSAGFTQEERDGFSDLLSKGFLDSFRELYPDKKDAYSYWTYMANARAKNVGWRLDYFVISERLRPKLCDNVMRSHVLGSDHCPIVLALHM